MLFNSFAFAIFLPVVFILYWIIPNRYRWGVLLLSSYYFYMHWDAKFVFLILIVTTISFFCGLLIDKTEVKSKKRVYLLFSIICSLGVLFIFKYFNFFFESLSQMANYFGIPIHVGTLRLLLPVGISFYTFQTIGYVIDIYRRGGAEHHFGVYAAFVSFFPQLVAGPIERTQNLLPQIRGKHSFNYDKAANGLILMAWGFFKKLLIADGLAGYVDQVYANVEDYQGLALIIVSIFFSLQIYCDFSGYSDIAIGTAKLFDIDLMVNFESSYFSASVKEFWRRWHISLSSWFRDYVYIPLGGNRKGKIRQSVNLLITFTLSGLWHGANWTYIVWGGIHGIGQVLENLFVKKKKEKIYRKWRWCISVCCVFLFCNVAWVFFRAESIHDAVYILCNSFVGIAQPVEYLKSAYQSLSFYKWDFIYFILLIGILFIHDFLALNGNVWVKVREKPLVIRWVIYILLVLCIVFFAKKGKAAEFVYFQF